MDYPDIPDLPEVRAAADFVLVEKKLKSSKHQVMNAEYISNLKKAGLTVDVVSGILYPQYNFITIKATDAVLNRLTTVHGLFPTYQKDNTMPTYSTWFTYFKTPVTIKPNVQHPLFLRVSNSVRGRPNTTFTSAERINLISNVLKRIKYGTGRGDFGLGSLLARKSLEDAYPLHDGPWEWTEEGPLNDRQVLAKYWGCWSMFYKCQPIHIIFKYYGSEIAFFYAWLEYYMKTLVIPCIFGLIVLIAGYMDIALKDDSVKRVTDVCESKLKMCPSCTHKHCYYVDLSSYCDLAGATYPLDNIYTVALAIFITVWATVCLDVWNRNESIYSYRWNLIKSSPDVDELPNYRYRVRDYRIFNIQTKTTEYYTPFRMKFLRYFISFLGVLGFISVVFATNFMLLILEHFILYYFHKYPFGASIEWMPMIMKIYSAFLNSLLIKFFCPRIDNIAKVLTDQEIHRTQNDYITAYIFKSYLMAFVNSYFNAFYLAFFKDIYFTYPGDIEIYNRMFGIASNVCPPTVGCVSSLSTSLTFMILRDYILSLLFNLYQIVNLVPFVKRMRKKLKKEDEIEIGPEIPQWEQEFSLQPISFMFFPQSCMSTIIEYGLIIFFTAAIPLLPVFALLNNIIELRVTAITLTKRCRRNVSKRVLGLGAWRPVLRVATRMSFLISGCVIAFTTTFVHRAVYFSENLTMKGFVNDTLSEFLVDDYKQDIKDNLKRLYPDVDICYYSGQKNSYAHPNKYEFSNRFYYLVSMKLVVVVIYIHAVYFLNGLLSFYMRKIPLWVLESESYDSKKDRMKQVDKILGTKTK